MQVENITEESEYKPFPEEEVSQEQEGRWDGGSSSPPGLRVVGEGDPTPGVLAMGRGEAVFPPPLWGQVTPGRRFCVDGETLHRVCKVQ